MDKVFILFMDDGKEEDVVSVHASVVGAAEQLIEMLDLGKEYLAPIVSSMSFYPDTDTNFTIREFNVNE